MIDERERDLRRWNDQVCYRTRNFEAEVVVGGRVDRPFPISMLHHKSRQQRVGDYGDGCIFAGRNTMSWREHLTNRGNLGHTRG